MTAPKHPGRRVILAPRPQTARVEPKKRARSQSLERGLDVLETVAAEGGELGVRELARRCSLSPSIVQRLVSSLAGRGYLEKNRDTARYRLGHRALALGASGEGAFDYVVAARRELEQMAHQHHLNGFVSVLRGGRAIYLLAVQADGPVAIKVSPGSEMPLHSTSAGKVLLASLSDGEARKVLGPRKLTAITPHTITDPGMLVASLAKVRRQGFALVNEENIPGVLSVGAPICDRTGAVIAALSVAFPKYLDSGLTLASVEPLVTAAALRISRLLGMPSATLLTLGSVSGGT
ncbi:transcriptional regulator, IclR family [Enhydrobacter aerosaccus]|uniref:Transcriptional regulator, IclR family n=1 Tax=Enhydrobacter aerosaccus TaxID=225324 RepID=A0A1T4NZD8_9HYPH|nr:IclR family transcriptional regulator [Enhydrobacter aerosaccus]SJZ84539.1 transcriptional regulator, IclR family [Enhydrobacter aerosaccus]